MDKNFLGFILTFGIPLLVVIFLGKEIFTSQAFKEARQKRNIIKQIILSIFGLMALAITAFISWVLAVFIALSTGLIRIGSTYGTPIYRPKIK